MLFANTPFMMGMGLLSGNQPSLTPTNPMQSVMSNMMAGQQMKAQMTQDQMAQTKYDLEMKKLNWQMNQKPERKTMTDRNGVPRYMDTGEAVFSGVKKQVTPKQTNAMINAEALGLIPGTPEYNKYINDYTLKPVAPQINMPATKEYVKESDLGNYRKFNYDVGDWEYPVVRDTGENLAKQGFEFVPNHVLQQENDNKNILEGKTAINERMIGYIDQYQDTLNKIGTKILPGEEKQLLESDYTQMQMEAKNFLELGVLAGEDLTLMQAIANDPTSIIANFIARDGDLSGLNNQLNSLRTSVNSVQNVYKGIYGKKTPKANDGLNQDERSRLKELEILEANGELD